MKFDKKFNVKHLVTVSAVALAMIGGSVAITNATNNNVHADDIENGIDYTMADKISAKSSAKNDKSYDAFEAKLKAQDEPDRKADALSVMKQGGDLNPNLVHDPVVKSYLESKGYSDKQIQDSMDTPEKDEQEEASTDKYIANSDKDALKDADSDKASGNPISMNQLKHLHHNNNNNNGSMNPSKPKQTTTPSKSKRTHLSKATVRKIMNSRKILKRMKADKRAIRKDKKRLSSRNARKFMRNYTKRSKSLKRTKRAQKRAMAVKGAKRYVRYYKDEVKHEKDLVRLIKSNRVSKVTKRHARRSLKRVRKNIRKNRKNVKRAHKVTRHHNSKNRK